MTIIEQPTTESLLHLRTDIAGVLTIFSENHDSESVATALMLKLGARYNQTGVASDPAFLSGAYWREIHEALAQSDQEDPFNAPDAISGTYTNEFILAQELEKAHYTAQEALAVIKKMRKKESMRQRILSRWHEVGAITDEPEYPGMATPAVTRLIRANHP